MPTQQEIDALAPWWQTVRFPDGASVKGLWDVEPVLNTLLAGRNLAGRTVLDIGCMAGVAMVWAERRGARCRGFDADPRNEEQVALVQREFGSAAEFWVQDLLVGDLPAADIVFLLGVYYHLRHPLLGIDRAWAAAGETLVVEGEVLAGATGCYAQFCPGGYKGDSSNWWIPTPGCLRAWLEGLPGAAVTFIYPLNGHPSRAGAVVERTGGTHA